ncbi:Ams1p [Sugiyamaella lignohabitans]|uniref:Alpha-mannosidase n=1 Tax=Sugiyamaella lignohabitans TaxID=796027 RepID=A0A161HNB9_9ASCO|nr:Ams1p [Sugiyamaella lignohabitans]ANB15617.1 Ams1p [Sugiyamaella lignohabitans]
MSSYPHLLSQPIAKKVDSIYRNRLGLFLQNGQYKTHSLPATYDLKRISSEDSVVLYVYSVDGTERPSFESATSNATTYRLAKVGDSFGPSWSTHWFRVTIKVPSDWKKISDEVIFHWDCGNEGFVFLEDGRPQVGLSGEERQEWILPKDWVKDGKWHTFYIETSCNAMFGNADPHDNIQPPTSDRYYKLATADLVLPNKTARALKHDYAAIMDCALNLSEDSWQKHRALEVANEIIDTFDEADPDTTLPKCREIAAKFLGNQVDSAAIFDSTASVERVMNGSEAVISGLGHCHIDTAWLWPYAETRRKIGRSWASQLDLIQRYPEYNFACSQAVQYQWLKEDYPELFERLKKQVEAGRFIPVGGSWVECDTNIPSGESVARQFLYGQRFFQDNFNLRSNTFWLPDTFGYSAQIPQLCRQAGIERFLTQKLSWNNINKFPNTTFNWVALDGSQVICHMPPADTYNSNCSVSELKLSVNNNKNRGIHEKSLLLFGYGDGGGGPTTDMLERMRRNRGISDTVGEIPRVEMHGNVDKFFDQIAVRTDEGKKLVSWIGELYFEFHRGTYTTQANTKKNNRASEVLLHDVEFAATIASIVNPAYQYPKAKIDEMWELTLLNQFHDVLPGSSIEMVYQDVDNIYSEINKIGTEILRGSLDATGIHLVDDGTQTTNLLGLNTLPWQRSEIVKVPIVSKGSVGSEYVHLVSDPSSQALAFSAVSQKSNSPTVTVKEVKKGVFVFENSNLRATITGGLLTSLYDKANNYEMVPENEKGNQFVIFEDQPLNWQGWDTEVYSLNKAKKVPAGTTKIVENGPLHAAIVVEQQISERSWIKTTISLDAVVDTDPLGGTSNLSCLEYNSEVEWRESCKFLKVEFPVDVHEDFATYDSMYGSVKRPTHYNTMWDVAKFEVCCHKYADLSDFSYGVTVLNDSKYGFSAHGNIMRLSLLRSAKAPDGNADMGRHNIRYAILGHAGRINANVIRVAHNFNHPLRVFSVQDDSKIAASTALYKVGTLVRFSGPENIIVSAVKRGEDDPDVISNAKTTNIGARKTKSVIVRLHDSLGGKTSGDIVTLLPVKKVFKSNILEDDGEEVEFHASSDGVHIPVTLRAFEIATYRLELA